MMSISSAMVLKAMSIPPAAAVPNVDERIKYALASCCRYAASDEKPEAKKWFLER